MNRLILKEADLSALHNEVKALRLDISNLRNKKNVPEHRYLTRQEVCDMLHISYSTLHRMVRSGELPCIKSGKRVLFRMLDVENTMESVNS